MTLFLGVGVVNGLWPVAPGRDRLGQSRPFCALGWVLTRPPLACVAGRGERERRQKGGPWASGCACVGPLWAAEDDEAARTGFPPLEPSALGPRGAGSCASGVSRLLRCHLRLAGLLAPEGGGGGGGWSFTTVRSPLRASRAVCDDARFHGFRAACQAFSCSVSSAALPGGGAGEAGGAGSSAESRSSLGLPPLPGHPLPLSLIDVVTLRSPGPGQSRARRGTGVHGECSCASRSASGPLASPPHPLVTWGRQGCGIRSRPCSWGPVT